MPYTPPSTSPSSLHSVSPVKSSSSYAGLANSHAPQPSLKQPHAHRSHSNYHSRPTNHHRRSSGPTSPPREPIPVKSFAQDRPSPVRRTSSSSTDSDEDDEDNRSSIRPRDSRDLHKIEKLRDVIREKLPQHKAASPPGSPDRRYISNSVLSPNDNLPHLVLDTSRYDSTTSDGEHSSSTTPPDDDIEFPRMVRKKSGEIVKPSLKPAFLKQRPLSLPSTPVFPKAVHFDDKLEHVRHFLHSEKPLAVSTDTSPSGERSDTDEFPFKKEDSEEQYQIELPNFPSSEQANRRDLPVHVDSVFLGSDGRSLIGKVIVKNLAFKKWVAVRFTFDHWQTVSEAAATYDSTQDDGTTPKDPAWDRFMFNIKLVDFTNLENRQMFFCVRYNVVDQEYWDNNYGSNYQVQFRKRPNYLLRRSSHPPKATGVSRRASDDSTIGDDFDVDISPETFAKDLAERIASPRSALFANLGESIPFVKKATLSSHPSVSSNLVNGTPQKRQTGKVFANRYDFEASLNATISGANAAIAAEKSGYQKTSSPKLKRSSDSYFAPLPVLFRPSPPVQSPIELAKEDYMVSNIKKSHFSGLQQTHHFRARSYPLGSHAQSQSWMMDDAKEGYSFDDSTDKPPIYSSSYMDFITNYCFVWSTAIIC